MCNCIFILLCLPFENLWWVKKSSPKITEVSDFSFSISVHYLAKTMLFSHHLNWTIFFFKPDKKLFLNFDWRLTTRAANNKGRTISQTDMANTIMLIVWRSWRSCIKWEILQFWNDESQMDMCFLLFEKASDFSWAGDLFIALLRMILRERWRARAIARHKRQVLILFYMW